MPITQKMSDNLKTYTNAYMSNVTGCHPSVSCINISAPGLYELHSKYKSPDDLNFPSLYILSVNGKIVSIHHHHHHHHLTIPKADFDHSKIRYFTVPFIPPMYISAYTKLKKLICLAWEFVECNKFLRLTLPYLPSLEVWIKSVGMYELTILSVSIGLLLYITYIHLLTQSGGGMCRLG